MSTEEKRCIYCGQAGHRSSHCPNRQPLRERVADFGCWLAIAAVGVSDPLGFDTWQFWVLVLTVLISKRLSFVDGVRQGAWRAAKHFVDSVDEYVRRHPE